MSELSEIARQLGDQELVLNNVLEHETYEEVRYLIHVLGRAQDAIGASKRALIARQVPINESLFDALFWELQGVYNSVTPILLAHAVLAAAKGQRK